MLVPMTTPADVLTRKAIRGTVLALWGLAACSIVLACLPGYDVYERGQLVETRAAGGAAAAMLATWLTVPGIVVWIHPRRALLFGWSVLAWLGFLIYFAAMFELHFDWDLEIVQRWPAQALSYALGGLLLILLVFVPSAVVVHRIVEIVRTRRARRAAAPPGPPIARIHRER